MALPSTLLLIFSSATLVSGQLHPVIETSTEPRTVEPGEKRRQDRDQRSVGSLTDNPECQEGEPLGATYIGRVNVTIGVKTGQPRNLMNQNGLMWGRWERLSLEITTFAGTLLGLGEVSGATPPIQISGRSIALYQDAMQLMNVKI